MTSCARGWVPTMFAMALFASGCGPSGGSLDGGPGDGGGDTVDLGDAHPVGAACSDEGRYLCEAATYQCCDGVWISYIDGPCWPVDGGTPDCATYPTTRGCPCTAGSASMCVLYQPLLECVGGVWTSSGTHACCI